MALTTKSSLNLVLGAGNVGDTSVDPTPRFDTPDEVRTYFSAFAPAAAGFFAGNPKNPKTGGPFDSSPAITEATDKTVEVAARYGIGGYAAALRWTSWHSILRKVYGNSIIIGSSSIAQSELDTGTTEVGPLPEDVVAALEALYYEIGDELHYHL
ncbi:hypothetical protein AnigIFM50267_003646 [Aspergillus niger]|nr:hypothetical protein AnigIFM50267_003646 [Aspergillus niger]